MADKNNLIHEGTPVVFTNIKGSIDKELVNPELMDVDVLSKIENLTPFRKGGSLVLCPSQVSQFTNAQLPTPSGYYLYKAYVFSVDKSTTDIYLLVYLKTDSAGEVKMFINRYWNPATSYSNYNPCVPYSELNKGVSPVTASSESWVVGWMELTEYYSLSETITNTGTFTISIPCSTTPLTWTNYLQGWFVVNTDYDKINNENFITASLISSGNLLLTLKAMHNWSGSSNLLFFRFPTSYKYGWDINNPIKQYQTFNGLPTDFICKENQLRMPCGKDKKPLILDYICERKYFYAPAYQGGVLSSANVINDGWYCYGATTPTILTLTNIGSKGGAVSARMKCSYGTHAPTCSAFGGTAWADGYYRKTLVFDGTGSLTAYTPMEVLIKVTSGIPSVVEVYNKGSYNGYTRETDAFKCTEGIIDCLITVEYWEVENIVITATGTGYTANQSLTFTADTGHGETAATGIAFRTAFSDNEIWYDGFWFDFQQLPQQLKNTPISSFELPLTGTHDTVWLQLLNGGGTNYFVYPTYTDPVDPNNYIARIEVNYNHRRIQWHHRKGTLWTDIANSGEWAKFGLDGNPSNAENARVAYNGEHGIVFSAYNNAISQNVILQILGRHFTGMFNVTLGNQAVQTNMDVDGYTSTQYADLAYHSSSYGKPEAGNRKIATNDFINSQVEVFKYIPPINISRNAFIVTAIYDNRNEVIIAQGVMDTTQGIDISFGLWFSRRLTGFNIYNRYIDSSITSIPDTMVASVVLLDKYPYFSWTRYMTDSGGDEVTGLTINELPLFGSYSLYDVNKPVNGEISYKISIPLENINCFRYYDGTGIFKTKLNKEYHSLNENGRELKWIVNANRFIDQDITMNYTKGTFVGQTNGRYFLVGCKNSIESEVFQNDDMIFPNTYAVGVSQYDIILRDSNINVFIGDKDTVTTLSNYGGYLTIIKKNNIYALDVNTEGDELRYRVIDTMMNRGTNKADSVCNTPYGIVVPLDDGVFLVSPDGITPLLTSANGNLYRYMYTFASASSITSVFYNAYNELIIYLAGGSESAYETLGFVYNFNYKFWTVYRYGSYITQVLNDGSKKVIMVQDNKLSGVDRKFNITYMFENTVNSSNATFLPPSGTATSIVGLLETHFLPFGARVYNTRVPSITATYDYKSTETVTMKLTLSGNSDVVLSARTISLTTSGGNIKYNRLRDLNMLIDDATAILSSINFSTMVKLKIETTGKFDYLSINSIVLWIKQDNRVRQLT